MISGCRSHIQRTDPEPKTWLSRVYQRSKLYLCHLMPWVTLATESQFILTEDTVSLFGMVTYDYAKGGLTMKNPMALYMGGRHSVTSYLKACEKDVRFKMVVALAAGTIFCLTGAIVWYI